MKRKRSLNMETASLIKLIDHLEQNLLDLKGQLRGDDKASAIKVIEQLEQNLYDFGAELTGTSQVKRYGELVDEFVLTEAPKPIFAGDPFRDLKPLSVSQLQGSDNYQASHTAGFIAFGLACRFQVSQGEQGTPVLYFALGKSPEHPLKAVQSAIEEQNSKQLWTSDLNSDATGSIFAETLPIYFHQDDEVTIPSIKRLSRMMLRTQDVHLIIIDDLERVTSISSEGSGESTEILFQLEVMAKELNIEVLVINHGEQQAVDLKKVEYNDLNSKQKEIYNFQTVAGKLAEYGFNCIKLADDWNGADFLAYHYQGNETLKVQLKSRLTVSQHYIGKEIYMTFPIGDGDGDWYLIEHDRLVEMVRENIGIRGAETNWTDGGIYHVSPPNALIVKLLEPFKL
ncbi:MAG: AAA family ATPase [Rhodospirillales bacterium]|nr:AAA family ATPase [Rhodospirillales bacterium]